MFILTKYICCDSILKKFQRGGESLKSYIKLWGLIGGLHSKTTLLTFYLANLASYLLRSSLKWYALNMKYAPNSQLLKSSISL